MQAAKVAKKLRAQKVSGYSNDSNPFGDSNLNERYVFFIFCLEWPFVFFSPFNAFEGCADDHN